MQLVLGKNRGTQNSSNTRAGGELIKISGYVICDFL